MTGLCLSLRNGLRDGLQTMTACIAFRARPFLIRLGVAMAIVFFALLSRAGGPKYVAGASYFNTNMSGQPLVWPQGVLSYYTDQGELSPILSNAAANAFVADAFSQWTAVPTAALAASNAGQLAEDVNGSNVTVNSNGSISMPSDIQPTATATPIAIVYDYDGSVTNALLGSGAGDASQCFFNAAFGGDDNYGAPATYLHALVVINGQCAQESSQLVDVEYRLVRVLGGVIGVGWSQLNPNVLTNNPPPTGDDFAGFPVMHSIDPPGCVPITRCYANPYQLAIDDVAAVSRLYPVTTQNQSGFPGKQLFASATARIHGSVWFTDASGNPTQPMQGVNVVARWIDPANGLPSRRFAASSVSGFLFIGNAGNPVTGFTDELGDPYSEWGSSSPTVEGSFDLAGLPLENGSTAKYQLCVEELDPIWSSLVGSYAPRLVAPSGLPQPVVVTLKAGQDLQQDILMAGSAQPMPPLSATNGWTTPAAIPPAGDWVGSLSGYGDMAYLQLPVQNKRTLSVAVKALDESGNPSELKAQPVIGMWNASDQEGTASPAFTPSPFNTVTSGLTRLDAQFSATGNFLIGISDLRGDGRPDYHYQAHVLYADSVSPPRVSVAGGAVVVAGTGFSAGLASAVGTAAAPQLQVNAGQMILAAPAFSDGPQSIAITDPVSGASSIMTNALVYGAAASDKIILVGGSLNPATPVGVQATYPMSVRVLQSDGVTPVSGATVGWIASNNLQLSACGGTSACPVTTDQGGNALSWLTPSATGNATITATLAPGVYSPAQSVSASLTATESPADLGVLPAYLWIAQGATTSVPLTARVLANGSPRANVTVTFTVETGSATLSAASAVTSSTGYAAVMLSVTQLSSTVQVSACIGPANAPCLPVYITAVAPSQLNLQPVAGGGQVSAGQPFQPVVVRVTDSSSPPNPVLAANVTFVTTVVRPGDEETNPTNPVLPVILSVGQTVVPSDISGLASIVPSGGGFSPPLEVDVGSTAGANAALDDPLELLPGSSRGSTKENPLGRFPVHVASPIAIERK